MQPRWHFHLFYYTQKEQQALLRGLATATAKSSSLQQKGKSIRSHHIKQVKAANTQKNQDYHKQVGSSQHPCSKHSLTQSLSDRLPRPRADRPTPAALWVPEPLLLLKDKSISSRAQLALRPAAGFLSQQGGHQSFPNRECSMELGLRSSSHQPLLHNQSQIPNPGWHP